MKLLGTGLSGLVGSFVTNHLSSVHEFQNLSLETGIDITNETIVNDYLKKSPSPWVLHFAAKTDVDGAEKERVLGDKSPTWIVNVKATEILVNACRKYDKKLLYLSTDFVFPGGDKIFLEEDIPRPIGWYAETKYEGEKLVASLGNNGLIVRISFPYGAISSPRPDFVLKIASILKSGREVVSPEDQIFTPTYLEDIAIGINKLINIDASGIYHLVGPNSISSLDAAMEIARVFGLPNSLVKKTTAAEFYQNRSPRAFHLTISNAKIIELGLKPTDFKKGIQLYYQLIVNKKVIY